MATVFLARAEGLGGFERDVAVKLLHAHLRENNDLALSLLNEARIAARIRHPNVVPVYDVGDDPAGIFLVMEYVEGDTLSGLQRSARAAGERIPTAIGLRILTDALAGLDSAHEQRDAAGAPLEIVHRDFSPQNILVGIDGISRLTDFGIAKAAGRLGHTSPGAIKGKVGYMAPEQARGKVVDRRCDVWAAGVVAWELLAGRPLHDSDDEVATLLDVVTQTPPDLRSIDATIPDALADAVGSALVVDHDRRCPTAAEFRRRLINAAPQKGALAETAQVAAFIGSLGGGRSLTPLPQETPEQAAPAPGPTTPEAVPFHSPHETMTLQSSVVASVASAADSSAALPAGRRWSKPGWARPWIGVAVLTTAVAAGAALFNRPPAEKPLVALAPPARPIATTPATSDPVLTVAQALPDSPSAVVVTDDTSSTVTQKRPDRALLNTVARLAPTEVRSHGSATRPLHPGHRAHARAVHAKSAPSIAVPHAVAAAPERAAHAPHAPPPLAGNPYAGPQP